MSARGELLVAGHRREQIRIRSRFLREFVSLWSLLAWEDLDGTFVGWARAVMAELRARRQESAEASATLYQRLRLAEAPADTRIVPPEPIFTDPGGGITLAYDAHRGLNRDERARLDALVARSVGERVQVLAGGGHLDRMDWSEPARPVIDWGPADKAAERALLITGPNELKRRAKLKQDAKKAKREVLALAAGTASRHVTNGGRRTTMDLARADKVALGWARVTGPSPCSFCVMLASRGGNFRPYRTRATAAFKPHDNCMCQPVPIFNKLDWPGRDQQREWRRLWLEVTEGRSGNDARNAFRRHWEGLQREAARKATAEQSEAA